jgi:aldehyde:ferredoxin oxidoreductase
MFLGASKISDFRKRSFVKDTGCIGCPIKCTKVNLAREGPCKGSVTEGPEYESIYALGSACSVDDPDALINADMLCDDLGLDTMSTGLTIAWAMECFEKKLIDSKGKDELKFGDYQTMLDCIRKIAYKDGDLGRLLSQGTKIASSEVGKGSAKFAMNVKGMELGGYDARVSKGQALVFSCGPRGGCHHAYGTTAWDEIAQGNLQETNGKGKFVAERARQRILFDSSPMCSFYAQVISLDLLAQLVSSTTGMEMSDEDFADIARRTATVERLFNLREGITRADDTLPERLFEDPIPQGPYEGKTITRQELEAMKDELYVTMGWDLSGVPTKETLKQLDLQAINQYLT